MLSYCDQYVERFGQLRVVVVGDVMLDRYVIGRVRRISPEAPVPVVEVDRTVHRPGGAGNVAVNLMRLGAKVALIGLVGDDGEAGILRKVLAERGLGDDSAIVTGFGPTTVKTRIVAQGQQIVRVDREGRASLQQSFAEQLYQRFMSAGSADVIILSDYAKGVLSAILCRQIIDAGRERGTPVVVDPKGHDYQRYARATAITPNQLEAGQAVGSTTDDGQCLDRFRELVLGSLGIKAGIVTRGEEGVSILLANQPITTLPATAVEVTDVTGAGDTFVAAFSLALGAGADFVESARLGNAAAGVVVEKVGAAAVTADELLHVIRAQSTKRTRRARQLA
jgi:D-beta-D-heptose 7-phosphate kinase/D-beta-D-heptose 1-phosphate adenosyltransferase